MILAPGDGALAGVGLTDVDNARRVLARLGSAEPVRIALEDVLPALLLALSETASPDRALVNLERFLAAMPQPATALRELAQSPRALEALLTVFAGSQYLSEVLLRDAARWQQLGDRTSLAQAKTRDDFAAGARAAMSTATTLDERLDGLRRYQRGELLRVGACDLLGLLDLPTVTAQLSRLAGSLIRICLELAAQETNTPAAGLTVLALGKLGGWELNYSSDIDLLFIAAEGADGYRRLGERLIDALARVTSEGFLYRVDMRLRPWGRGGALVSSLPGYLRYLGEHARLWEKQALLKARFVAGDEKLADEFRAQVAPLLFASRPEAVRADVRAMKRQIEEELARAGRGWGEVKSGRGSIRDVEFVTQYLQLRHGGGHPEVLRRNTLRALAHLAAGGFLSQSDYRVLADGYTFLRPVEHYLQMMNNRQTHTLPDNPKELTYLARRLGFQGADAAGPNDASDAARSHDASDAARLRGASDAGQLFVARYEQHSTAIRAVYARYLEGEGPEDGKDFRSLEDFGSLESLKGKVEQHLARMTASYGETFTPDEVRHHAEMAGRLTTDERVQVDAAPLADGAWRVTVVGYDYPGELSLICGLLFAYGFSIRDGHVFTYEEWGPAEAKPSRADTRRKIVDVFDVQPVGAAPTSEAWLSYARDLNDLLGRLAERRLREAQGELAKRVALALRDLPGEVMPLQPIDIEIDNDASERYTVLRISAPDTTGFLYEFTNALALSGIYIAQVTVETAGNRVHDTLHLTDAAGHKITAPQKQRELRAATVLVKHFTHLLPHSPNPETALLHFGEFLGELLRRPEWPDELASLQRPEVLSALARLLGVSEFLWDDFLRMQHANLFPVVKNLDALASARSKEQLLQDLSALLAGAPGAEAQRGALNDFKDREMFRIDMRHILGHLAGFDPFSAELTDLAEVVVEAAYGLCARELERTYGVPRLADGTPCPLAICALGKCGGRELGFASDIELMFVYASSPLSLCSDDFSRSSLPSVTGEDERLKSSLHRRGDDERLKSLLHSGGEALSPAEYFEKLVVAFNQTVRARQEGIFEIDLQLRPHGKAGSLAVSLESFRRYYAPGGAAWDYERQALIKLRPIAGDAALGAAIEALRDQYVYGGEPFNVPAMRAMRERQIRQLVRGGTINAKYSPGGLVDAEYLVQALQIRAGRSEPRVRLTNTMAALLELGRAGALAAADAGQLQAAYTFLRQLIDALRIVRGNAKDLTVPAPSSEEFAFLARRLGYRDEPARLHGEVQQHMASVLELSVRLLG